MMKTGIAFAPPAAALLLWLASFPAVLAPPPVPGVKLHLDAGNPDSLVLNSGHEVVQWSDSTGNPISLRIRRMREVVFPSREDAVYHLFQSADGKNWEAVFRHPVPGTGDLLRIPLPKEPSFPFLRVREVVSELHHPSGGPIPQLEVVDGLRLHLDASAPGTLILDGGRVDSWLSPRAGGPLFTAPDPSSRPTFSPAVANGRPAVTFDTGRFLQTQSPVALSMANHAGGITALAVAWNTGGGSQTLFRIGAGGSNASALRFMMGRRDNDHRLLARRLDDDSFSQIAGGVRAPEEWGIDSGWVDFLQSRAALFLNGVEAASSSAFTSPGRASATDSRMFRIGNDHSTQFWQGHIAELLIYDRVLSPLEKSAAILYLSEKYNIPVTLISETEIDFQIQPIAAVSFPTGRGNRYRVETSVDLIQWSPLEGEIAGDGFPSVRTVPLHGVERAFFRGWRVAELDPGRKHVGVFYGEEEFAAWPANYGTWSWGHEILVGFVLARHQERGGHTWDSSTARHKFARSLDGGLTWELEDAYESGITGEASSHKLGSLAVPPVASPGGIDFQHPDFAFTFRRRVPVVGPSDFYYSHDRGRSWEGPFAFPNLDTPGVANRTDYIVEGKHQMLAFLTTAKTNGQVGWTACARTTDGGKTWQRVSWIGPEPEGQAIMPSSLRLPSGEILTALRRTGDRSLPGARKWVAVYQSTDNGGSWTWLNDPADDLGWNSNPPTLLQLADGRIALFYAVRGGSTQLPDSRICLRLSADHGRSWGGEIVLRGNDGANRDMGYTRAVQRPDGKVVVIYYYNHALDPNLTPFRHIAATLFDPAAID